MQRILMVKNMQNLLLKPYIIWCIERSNIHKTFAQTKSWFCEKGCIYLVLMNPNNSCKNWLWFSLFPHYSSGCLYLVVFFVYIFFSILLSFTYSKFYFLSRITKEDKKPINKNKRIKKGSFCIFSIEVQKWSVCSPKDYY